MRTKGEVDMVGLWIASLIILFLMGSVVVTIEWQSRIDKAIETGVYFHHDITLKVIPLEEKGQLGNVWDFEKVGNLTKGDEK